MSVSTIFWSKMSCFSVLHFRNCYRCSDHLNVCSPCLISIINMVERMLQSARNDNILRQLLNELYLSVLLTRWPVFLHSNAANNSTAIMRSHGIHFHIYADNTRLYNSFDLKYHSLSDEDLLQINQLLQFPTLRYNYMIHNSSKMQDIRNHI